MLAWLRTEFRRINTTLEFEAPVGEARSELISTLLDGVALLLRVPSDPTTEDDVLAHLRAGMLHAACMRHGLAPDDVRLRPCVDWLLEVERRWSLAPRFLALPYLLLNTAEDGWPVTFLESEAERHFIAANADGVAIYETAWVPTARIRVLGLTSVGAASMLTEPPSHRDLVRQELAESGWLDEMMHAATTMPWGRSLAAAAVAVYDALVRATWAHMDLAVAFIDRGLGTSGSELRFLEETVRMRRDHPALARLRALAAMA